LRLAPQILRDRTLDAIHVMELGMSESKDADILEMARNHNRVCVTLDHDFHTHLALARQGDPSLILLRIEGLNAVFRQQRRVKIFSIMGKRRWGLSGSVSV
jgi:predicted nuclease of predicted toxin-antitoxin system